MRVLYLVIRISLESYFLLSPIPDLPIDLGSHDATLPLLVGRVMRILTAINDVLAVPLETVLHIQQLFLGPRQSIPLCQAGHVETLLWRGLGRTAICKPQFLLDGVFDAVRLVDMSDVVL
jgi:hypothetical protein